MRFVKCDACGANLTETFGPVHGYMVSSPACYQAFTTVLAAEYSDVNLLQTHRLTVDTYAVQHSGNSADRRCVQSVGLHLARLYKQLECASDPQETNQVMRGFSRNKASLSALSPPVKFRMTVADVVPFSGTGAHSHVVKEWAIKTWEDWSDHHDYIRRWVEQHLP